MATTDSKRFEATLTALRGVLMFAAAMTAFIFPALAVKFLILAGGGLLLVDGALGLATVKLSQPRTNEFWFGVGRNAVSVLAGLTVLFSPLLLGVFTMSFLTSFVGVLALLVGLVELGSGFLGRQPTSRLWPAMIGGALYVVFGLALIFVPLSSAEVLVRIATALAILYALLLFYRAWRVRSAGY